MSELHSPEAQDPVIQPTATAINVPQASRYYSAKEVKFNFRENKELGTKRPSVTLALKVLTIDGLIAILESGTEKEVSLVLETLQTPILEQARVQVDANETITQDNLDESALSWSAISLLEPAARRGGGNPRARARAGGSGNGPLWPQPPGHHRNPPSRCRSARCRSPGRATGPRSGSPGQPTPPGAGG